LRILLKQNTALLSIACPVSVCHRREISYFSHLYNGINAMLSSGDPSNPLPSTAQCTVQSSSSTTQYSLVLPSTAYYRPVQPITAQYSPVPYSTGQSSPVQISTVQYSRVQTSTAQYRLAQLCTAKTRPDKSIFSALTNLTIYFD